MDSALLAILFALDRGIGADGFDAMITAAALGSCVEHKLLVIEPNWVGSSLPQFRME